MWAALTATLVILTAYITSRVSAKRAKRIREEEERGRRERRKELLALEIKYLKQGIGDSWSNELPDVVLRSLGNIAFLIWLLNYEPKFRNFRGDAKGPYPPDWEWRRKFVFLRDRGICQGCKKDSDQGINLDCHHIKPIAEFGPEETGIHAISNLVALCPLCHAAQHLGNRMLANRASRSSSGGQHPPPYSGRRGIQQHTPNDPMRTFLRPEAIEVQPSSDVLSRQILSEGARTHVTPIEKSGAVRRPAEEGEEQELCPKANAKARSITGGLARIDEQKCGMKLQDADQLLDEEDQYGHCDFCDKEILIDPSSVSDRGRYLCNECYCSTGGKE